jgi:TP901 family phage tail tape measure protein
MALDAGSVFVKLGGKLDPGAFAKFEAETNKAGAQMEKTEKRIAKASAEASVATKVAADQQVAAMAKVNAALEANAGRYIDATGRMREANGRFVKVSEDGATAVERSEQRKQKAWKASDVKLSSSQKTWTNFAKGAQVAALAAGAGILAFVGVVAKATEKAAGFDQELKNMAARTTITAKQLKQVRQAALDLGTDFGVGATQAAKAATELVKGGVSVRNLLAGGLKAALALSVAGEMDVADAASTVANALNEFHLKGQDAVHVADALATSANATTADVKDFAMALSQGGAAAKTAGLSFDETTAFLEALASAGVKGSDAGTSMKTALTQLASPTKQSSDLMKKLGLDFFDAQGKIKPLPTLAGMLQDKLHGLTKEQRLQAATTLAGTDGMRGLLALYDAGPQKIKGFENGLKKQGTAAQVAAQQNEGAEGAVRKLKAAWEQAQIIVGEQLLPEIAKGAGAVTDKLKEMASDGSLKRMGDDLAKIAESLTDKLPDALDKVGQGVDHFGEIVDDAEQLAGALKFIANLGSLSTVFNIGDNPFRFLLEGAKATLVAIKGVAVAFDAITPGDQSGKVRAIQGAIDSLDRSLDRLKHKDLQISFKVDQASESKIFALVDQLDKKGQKALAIEITARTGSSEATIAALQAALKGIPEKVLSKVFFDSRTAEEQAAAFTALVHGVPAKTVTKVQTESKTAAAAILAFRALAAGVPATKVTTVLAETNSAKAEINGIIALIANIPSSKAVTITTTETHLLRTVQSGSTAHTVRPRGKAAGGKTNGRQLYEVGEGTDPVEWIIPRDPKYRDRAVGLLMDAAQSILPKMARGGKHGGRFVPPKLNPIAYSVDQFEERETAAQKARDDAARLRKNLATAQASLRDVERRNPKTAAQKANKADDLKRDRAKVADIRKQISELPEHGDASKLRAVLVERRKELAKAKAYQKQIDKQTSLVNIAGNAMRLADARGDNKGYSKAQADYQTAYGALRKLLTDAQALAQAAGNDEFVRALQEQVGQIDLDQLDSTAPITDEAASRLADTGMTDAERAVLAGITRDQALDALDPDLTKDKVDAQRRVDLLQAILNDALVNPARGGDATIADLAGQLKQAKDDVSSLAGGTAANSNADLQAQVDQANERTRVATVSQQISDAALQAFQGFAAGGPGGLAPVVNVYQSNLVPGSSDVLRHVGNAAAAGFDVQGYRRPQTVKVGL